MESLQELWSKRSRPVCREWNGLFFPDGTCVPIRWPSAPCKGTPRTELLIPGSRTPLDPGAVLGIQDDLDPFASVQHAGLGLVAHAGGTSWEGEGFVALTDRSDQILWAAIFDSSEEFTAIGFEHREVVATTCEKDLWRIPLDEPWRITVHLARHSSLGH